MRAILVLLAALGVSPLGCNATESVVLGQVSDEAGGSGGSGGTAAAGSGGEGAHAGKGGSGGGGGDGGAGTCANACQKEAETARAGCIAKGIAEMECQARFERQLATCLTACADRCREGCDVQATELLDKCLGTDTDAGLCVEHFVGDSTRCRTSCGIHLDTECAALCATEGRRNFGVCLEGGATEGDCVAKAKTGAGSCLFGCEVNPCVRECEAAAEEVFNACLEEGVAEAECLDRRKTALNECLPKCPDPPTCEQTCERSAEEEFQACLATGTAEATCKEKRQSVLEVCLGGCKADGGSDA